MIVYQSTTKNSVDQFQDYTYHCNSEVITDENPYLHTSLHGMNHEQNMMQPSNENNDIKKCTYYWPTFNLNSISPSVSNDSSVHLQLKNKDRSFFNRKKDLSSYSKNYKSSYVDMPKNKVEKITETANIFHSPLLCSEPDTPSNLKTPLPLSSDSKTGLLEYKTSTPSTNDTSGVYQQPKLKPMKLQFYKTKMCPWVVASGRCRKDANCRYAHSLQELRPLPDLSKTKMCDDIVKNGICKNLEVCKYAHSLDELRATHSFNKTKLCPSWLDGKCTAGTSCRFAHGEQELKTKQSLEEAITDIQSFQKSSLLIECQSSPHVPFSQQSLSSSPILEKQLPPSSCDLQSTPVPVNWNMGRQSFVDNVSLSSSLPAECRTHLVQIVSPLNYTVSSHSNTALTYVPSSLTCRRSRAAEWNHFDKNVINNTRFCSNGLINNGHLVSQRVEDINANETDNCGYLTHLLPSGIFTPMGKRNFARQNIVAGATITLPECTTPELTKNKSTGMPRDMLKREVFSLGDEYNFHAPVGGCSNCYSAACSGSMSSPMFITTTSVPLYTQQMIGTTVQTTPNCFQSNHDQKSFIYSPTVKLKSPNLSSHDVFSAASENGRLPYTTVSAYNPSDFTRGNYIISPARPRCETQNAYNQQQSYPDLSICSPLPNPNPSWTGQILQMPFLQDAMATPVTSPLNEKHFKNYKNVDHRCSGSDTSTFLYHSRECKKEGSQCSNGDCLNHLSNVCVTNKSLDYLLAYNSRKSKEGIHTKCTSRSSSTLGTTLHFPTTIKTEVASTSFDSLKTLSSHKTAPLSFQQVGTLSFPNLENEAHVRSFKK